MPNLSVITINYNDARGLESTIQSVIAQTVTDFEFVVVDGASTDGSMDVIKRYSDKINSWVSEKDQGIYDAQNKGISKAIGKYFIFLNSGDAFFDNQVVEKFYDFLKIEKGQVIYGNSNFIHADGSGTKVCPPSKLDLNFWYGNTLNHQAVFFKRDLFISYGRFSTEYRFASDFDFLFKVFLKLPQEFNYLNTTVCNYDNTGLTSKDENHRLIMEEKKKIMLNYVSRKVFNEMRTAYLSTLTLERKYMTIIRENNFLRTTLKPFYRFYKLIGK